MGRRKTHEQYIAEVKEIWGDEYQVLTTYTGSKYKVKVLHKECGTTYEVRADGLLAGYGCQQCGFKKITKTHEEYVQQVEELYHGEYEVVSEYTGALNKIDILHTKCGRVRSAIANSVLQGKTCFYCHNESRAKSQEEFEQEVYRLTHDEYKVKSPYKTSVELVTFKHNVETCGKVFKATPNAFISGGNRCPHCASSKGELAVKQYLDEQGITYIREKEYEDLVHIRPLRFDFYLPDVNLLIEYDGIQHFEPIEYFGGKDNFTYTQHSDNLKNTYCKNHNIPLLRIPYTEIHNIPNILKETLHNIHRKEPILI